MERKNCRLCKGENLVQFLDLGYHPHSDQFRDNITEPETWYPLRMNQCQDCRFVQLSHVVSPETLYQKDYLYEASITKTADKHWTEFADTVIGKISLPVGSRVLDIGSNDGTLLLKFKEKEMKVLGIDPCREVAEIAEERGIPTIKGFFGVHLFPVEMKFHLITGTNVFAHVDDLDNFMQEVDSLLEDQGVFVFESPYLADFLNGLEYDTVYHQHLSYLSLKPLIPFFEKFGFEIYDVERHALHGGGFRVYIARKGQMQILPEVKSLADFEDFTLDRLKSFAGRVDGHRSELCKLIANIDSDCEKIIAVSAPAKGQTLLNYTGIGKAIQYATEKSKLKIGRYTPGTHLKIYPDSKLIEDQPHYALILAWNFAEEIIKNNPGYKGKWIIPLPTIEVR